jgi:hypothetical protein
MQPLQRRRTSLERLAYLPSPSSDVSACVLVCVCVCVEGEGGREGVMLSVSHGTPPQKKKKAPIPTHAHQ